MTLIASTENTYPACLLPSRRQKNLMIAKRKIGIVSDLAFPSEAAYSKIAKRRRYWA